MLLRSLKTFFVDIIEVVVFAIAIFLFTYLLVIQPHKIRGASMEPNFPNNQYLLTDKVTYRFREPDRGDVIVFKAPNTNDEEFIKRIIVLPGETVSIKEGQIYINGRILNENYLADGLITMPGAYLKEGVEIKVPEESYVVLGDNRPYSSDSRAWGLITKDKITGRAWLIYWPISEFGTVEEVIYTFN